MRAVLLLLLSACAQTLPTAFDPEDVGGSRLSVLRQESAEGIGFSYGFWDHTLDLACDFRVASDGELRCLPLPLEEAWPTPGVCEERWVVEPSCKDADRPHLLSLVDDHWEVREAVATDEFCPNHVGATVLTPGEPVDPERFVRGQWVDEQADSGIGIRTVVSSDGARRVVSLLAEGMPCEPRSFYDGTWRCVPHPVDSFGYFADPDCRDGVYTSRAPVPVGAWILGDVPGSLDASRVTRPSVEADVVYFRQANECIRLDAAGRHLVTRGERADASTLPEVVVGWVPGASPSLRTVTAGHGLLHVGGVSLAPEWSVTDDGWERCTPMATSDGEVVCRPVHGEQKALIDEVRATCPSEHVERSGLGVADGPRLFNVYR